MKIDNRFSITNDKYNIIIVERVKTKAPDGTLHEKEIKKFYPDMFQACRAVLLKSIDTTDINSILSSITSAESNIIKAIKKEK